MAKLAAANRGSSDSGNSSSASDATNGANVGGGSSTSGMKSPDPATGGKDSEYKKMKPSQELNLPSAQQAPAQTQVPAPAPAPAPAPKKPELSLEEEISRWLKVELEDIFRATLDKSRTSNQMVYLESLSNELQETGRFLNEDDLESIYMEVLSESGVPRPFRTSIEYLSSIYQYTYRLKSRLNKREAYYDAKIKILSSISEFSCSYGLICFQVDDMFINNNIETSIKIFIEYINDMSGYLNAIIMKSIEQDGLLDLLNVFIPAISSKLYQLNLNHPSYNKYLTIFKTFIDIKPVAAIFTQIDGFQPPDPNNCLDYEHKTLLGPLLRLSPLIDEISTSYFGSDFNFEHANYHLVKSTYDSITVEYKLVIDLLFEIVNKLIRGSGETRERLMHWFAQLINLSHLRTGSHADPTKLPSDGITFNISVILIRLSAPFLEYPTYSKVDKIDINYFSNPKKLVDLKDESRVNSSIQEAVEYYDENPSPEGDPNFISHCFYLTLTYLNYGIGGISVRYDRLKNQIKQLKERIGVLQGNQVPPGTNPMMLQFLKSQLPKLNQQLNTLNSKKHTVKAMFSYRDLQLEIFDFIVGATIFLTKVIDPEHSFPQKALNIPIFKISTVSELDDQDFLKTKCPIPWKFFPEFFLEGIINYCKFTTNFADSPLVHNEYKLEKFIEFTMILIRCPEILGNPHMKSNIIEILFIGSLPMTNGAPGFLSEIFSGNEMVKQNILYSLLDLYVMVEKTGASSQFYDKFNSRYYISIILEELWKHDIYRNQLTRYSVSNVEFFVRFIARMLNDTTYLLDETFNELNAIHNYQLELRKRQLGQPENEELGNNDELLKNLESSERKAKSYMGLSNKTMELFKLFTKEVPQGFVLPELVDRLAGMLDYNLEAMVGPKASNLKVDDPTKYDFNPKGTLSDLCQIYCNLSLQQKFVKAVSKDGRSFNIKWFHKAEQILRSKTLTDPRIITKLVEFGETADAQRIEDENEELELGEIPDEFLDPLMFTLMEDPVILPGSRVSIDRSTIKAHLLSDSTDPFNRVPLKLEDVIDDVELREKISQFKREKSTKMQVD